MVQVGLERWPFTSQAGTLHAVPAGHSANWLRSPLFNDVRLLNTYEITCLYIRRTADGLFHHADGFVAHTELGNSSSYLKRRRRRTPTSSCRRSPWRRRRCRRTAGDRRASHRRRRQAAPRTRTSPRRTNWTGNCRCRPSTRPVPTSCPSPRHRSPRRDLSSTCSRTDNASHCVLHRQLIRRPEIDLTRGRTDRFSDTFSRPR